MKDIFGHQMAIVNNAGRCWPYATGRVYFKEGAPRQLFWEIVQCWQHQSASVRESKTSPDDDPTFVWCAADQQVPDTGALIAEHHEKDGWSLMATNLKRVEPAVDQTTRLRSGEAPIDTAAGPRCSCARGGYVEHQHEIE
eukprot:1955080-Pyramimonas_sp.AAC.1